MRNLLISLTIWFRFLYDSIVGVLVGTEQRRFDVHRELVCSKSDCFAKAFQEGFREAETKIIELPEQHVETFQYFVHWLYTNKLSGYFRPKGEMSIRELGAAVEASTAVHEKTLDPEDRRKVEKQWCMWYREKNKDAPILKLVSLYVLADTLQVRGLRDHITTFLIKVYGDNGNTFWEPPTKSDTVSTCTLVMSEAYARLELLPASCNIRHLIVHLHVVRVVAPYSTLDVCNLHAGFIYNCFVLVHQNLEFNEEEENFEDASTVCSYHIHDTACSPKTKNIVETEQNEW